MSTNTLNLDPSRTMPIQKRYMADMVRRFNAFAKDVRELIVKEDAFGLKDAPSQLQVNKRWTFETTEGKERSFRNWINDRVSTGILEQDSIGKPWQSKYVQSAYHQGLDRAYTDTKGVAKEGTPRELDPRAQFQQESRASPVATEQLRRLYTRNFTALEGVNQQMGTKMSRILADGFAHDLSPTEIARQMDREIKGISLNRALTIARTEIVYAHAEGQLDAFSKLGITKLGVWVEWSSRLMACKKCAALNGIVLSIKEARGLLPRHPNCKCAWILAEKDKRRPGQKWKARDVQRALEKSFRMDKPKKKKSVAKRSSSWLGAGKTIKKRR